MALKKLLIVVFILEMISIFNIVNAQEVAPLAQANNAWEKRHSLRGALAAMELYKKAAENDSTNYEALWKYGRSCYFYAYYYLSEKEKKEKKERKRLLTESRDISLKAIELKPDGVEAQYWSGIAYGCIVRSPGGVKRLIAEMEKVVELDKNFENGGGYRVLGSIYLKTPKWFFGIGDKEKALKYLEKAVTVGATERENYLYYAETLIALDRKEEAQKILAKALSMPINEKKLTEDNYITKELKKLAKKTK